MVSVDDSFVAEFVGFAVVGSGVDLSTAGHPIGEAFGIMVAASVATLIDWLPPEFASLDDESFL